MAQAVRVLVVDDSLFMRSSIIGTLETAGGFEIVGQGSNGHDAVAKCKSLRPNVITMDYNMPGMNGVEAVRTIMRECPTPVIMFSAHTRKGARETFDALAAGAVDFCTKPDGEVSANLTASAAELVGKLRAAATARPRATTPIVATKPAQAARMTLPTAGPKLVVIAVSTGGPAALTRVIPALPARTRFATVIVQHLPPQFTAALADRLNSLSAVRVREARSGDVPQPGTVLIAPGGLHLEFDAGGAISLTDTAPVNGCKPAADVTMRSAAQLYGRRAIGVVLTGMGRDGAEGVLAIKRADGRTLAQDQESCVIYGMPRAAVNTGAVDQVAPLDEIAPLLRYM